MDTYVREAITLRCLTEVNLPGVVLSHKQECRNCVREAMTLYCLRIKPRLQTDSFVPLKSVAILINICLLGVFTSLFTYLYNIFYICYIILYSIF